MTEQKVKRRGWVKNVAIIFLAVLLVLTFFSNTIMNHSLPQVATVNVTSGTITAKIRGYGKVEAYESYEVKLSQTRTVETVLVREGDIVTAGDVLFILSGEESEELETAIKTLEDLQIQYDLALLKMTELDFALEDRQIQKDREALAEAQALCDKNLVTDEELENAEEAVSYLKVEISSLNRDLEVINRQINDLGGSGNNSSQLTTLARQISDASAKVNQAQAAVESARIAYANDIRMVEDAAYNNLMGEETNLILNREWKDDGIDNFGKTFKEWRDYFAVYDGINPEVGWEAAHPLPAGIDSAKMENDLKAAVIAHTMSSGRYNIYMEAQATTFISSADTAEQKYASGYNSLRAAVNSLEDRKAELSNLQMQYQQLLSEDNSADYQRLNDLKISKQNTLDYTNTLLEKAQEELADLQAKRQAWKDADAQVKSLQDKLETDIFNLAQSKEDAETQQAIDNLNLQKQRNEIEDQKELIAELQADTVDKAVTAPVAGKIVNLNVSAGNKTGADALAVIELTDRGYQLSFSVSAEQAKRVSVGEIAEVSNYYWGAEIKAKLISIKNDPENPREKKLLTFEITGDVESGTQLNLTLGSKGVNYELVVPNSAIRTDNNGDFVLIYVTKQTPLGARYVATRVDVRVLDKDDFNSAVSGGLSSWGDYVITSSNKPLEPGDFVRLAEDAG
jgi:multidrug efflux pump subunit AcrA (membrane-fusion protein)